MDIPTSEPKILRAGTTTKWTRELRQYPPEEGWALTYCINGPKHSVFNAVATGSDSFTATIAADVTYDWPAGEYIWEARAVLNGESYFVNTGRFTVIPNAEIQGDGTDVRMRSQRILDAHMACYETYAGQMVSQYSFTSVGRSFVYRSLPDLVAAIQFWKGQVLKDKMEENIANGLNTGQNVFVRFGPGAYTHWQNKFYPI
jgi:hypothetical protein